MSRVVGVGLSGALVLGHAATGAVPARAQAAFQVRPLLGATQVYDSNLFSTPSNLQSDFISRLSPGIESDYRSTLLTLTGRYALDLERFAHRTDLSTMNARQHASIAWGYRPSPRLALTASGDFLTTLTPGELNATTGLTFTRERAQRATAQSSLTRQLNPVTSGTIDYTFTEDRLARGLEARTHTAAGSAERRVSPRDVVRAGYRFREFTFGSPATETSAVASHALSVGWTRAMTRRIKIAIGAGPRVTGGTFGAEVLASVDARFRSADLSLGYARTQTTVIGVAGTAEIQNVMANASWTPARSLTIRMAPGFFRNALAGHQADVYVLGVGILHPISDRLSFDLTFDGSLQRGNLFAARASETIVRQAVMIRLVTVPAIRPH